VSDTSDKDRERFVRWQAILREHLSYAINLFLTYSVAAFGYCLSLLRDKSFVPTVGVSRCSFWVSILFLWASIVLGIFCVLNRLSDFRGTAGRARKAPSGDAPEQEYLDMLGQLTWKLFYWQVALFALGTTALGVVILRENGAKLTSN
jgi:hypothetical protein